MNAHLRYIRWAVLRQTPLAVAVIGLGTVATFATLQLMPNQFTASTHLLVEATTVSKDARKSTEELVTTAQLQSIEARLMTKARLRELAASLDTDKDVETLYDAITFDTISGRGKATTMEISVTDTDGGFAAAAANLLADQVLQEHQAIRSDQIDDSLRFFRQEVADTKVQLDTAFEALLDFKTTNTGALPEDASRYLDQRKALLLQRSTPPKPVSVDPVRKRLEAELTAASSLYSGRHPIVRALQAQLANAPEQADAPAPTEPRVALDIARIDTTLAAIPTNGLRLAALERTHSLAQVKYEAAMTRLESAAIEERIAQRAKGDRISIVEAATQPVLPAGPRRKIALSGGIAISCILALLLCLLRSRTDPVLRRPKDLKTSMNIIPYAVIPAR